MATGIFDLANLDASFGPYGLQDEIAFLDGWGNPIILQWPTTADPLEVRAKSVRLISAGPPTKTSGSKLRGVIDTLATTLMPTRDQRGNDLLMFLRTQDQYP